MRIIQVGFGGWGTSWFDVAGAAESVEVAAVAELSLERRAGIGPAPAFATLDEALAATDAEAVLVTSPPQTHHKVTTTALEAGRHVQSEKPLATILADAQSLVQTAQRTGRNLMVRP
jgi:predicted dehydrogenase